MYDYYDYGFLAAFFGVIMVIIVIALGFSLLLYILRSIGLMTIARNRGMQNPWLTWIPVVGVYTLGAIADDIHGREGRQTIYRWLLLGGNILAFVLSSVSGSLSTIGMLRILSDPDSFYYGTMASGGLSWLGSLINLAVYVISVICLYYLYKCYKPYSATSYTVLSVIFAFMQSIFPFTLRNNQPNWVNPPYPGGPGGPGGGYMPPQDGQWQPPQNGQWQPPQADPYQPGGQQPPQDGDPPKQL